MKIAVIGTGLIGRKHVDLIDRNANFSLSSIVNPSNDCSDILERFDVTNFTTHQELIESGLVEAAIISSPNETHSKIAIDLIEAGIAVLIEKPIAASVEEGLAIEEAAERCGVPVLVGHHRRHNPIIQRFQKIIEERGLGEIVGFSGLWSVYKPDSYFDTAWRVGSSGGLIMINLIHEIDYLQQLLGPIVSVGARQSAKRRAQSSEEAVALILEFENGVLGTIFVSDSAASPWSWEQATGENDPMFPQTRESPYRFVFDKGAVEFPRLKIWSQQDPDWINHFVVEDQDMLKGKWDRVFADQISHFYEVACGHVKPAVTARSATETLNVALTVKRCIEGNSGFCKVPLLQESRGRS